LTLIRQGNGGHRIELRAGDLLVCCLESIEPEGGADSQSLAQNWPASPPAQEWHDETRGGVTVLMAVGRAGHSHWSLSCEVSATGTASFDVAARIGEPPERLGSCYRLLATAAGAASQSSRDQLQLSDGWKLMVDPATTRLRYEEADRTVHLEPATHFHAAWPQTIRWRYWFERSTVS
jgi:hypothetical protein